MKKFMTILVVMMAMALSYTNTAKAQSATLFPLVYGDTIIASSSSDTVSKVIPVTAGYSVMGVQVNATKVSGTVALKAYIYGSMDGSNYVISDSSAAFADQTTNVVQFQKTTPAYTYYKVMVRPPTTAASTQSVIIRVRYVLRKYDR